MQIGTNSIPRVFVAGHRGLVGAALVRALQKTGGNELILRTSADLDLRCQRDVDHFFSSNRIDQVYLAAARVGGIWANSHSPGEFIRDNLQIQTNVIDAAYRNGVTKLCFLGSSCIYPARAQQPMTEDVLLTGPLEETNQWYAIAKIAGLKMCQAYRRQFGFNAICLMPTNLYGPGDNFNLHGSHVLPALLRRFHEAKESLAPNVVVWGTGEPRREFLHVDDLAAATVQFMQCYEGEQLINIGAGSDISIRELATLIRRIVGFEGQISFDSSKPDGAPRKLLDVSRALALGWQAKIELADGIASTYRWFVDNRSNIRD